MPHAGLGSQSGDHRQVTNSDTIKGGCSYVADFIFTLLAIERQKISNKSQYAAIQNATYVELADKLGIRDTYYSSPNNTGNVMESLCWFAYEQERYDFILSIVKFAADFEYPDKVASGPAAVVASNPVNLRKRQASAPPTNEASSQSSVSASKRRQATFQREADLEYLDTVASGPAAAVDPHPAKVRRRQTSAPPTNEASSQSSGNASWRRQDTFQKDVQETAVSASGHAAAPAFSESIGRRTAVQDRQPSEEEQHYDEYPCMSMWTRAKLKDYEELNKHAMGRQEEMEKWEDWLDLQVDNENARRQQRSNKGQTLEMLQQTAMVPDKKLRIYLDAYLSLCGTAKQQFDRRFQHLEQRFDRPWDALCEDIAFSVAEPKERSDNEADEMFKRFKLAYKESCQKRFSKQNVKIMNRFIRDIFQDKDGFMKYLSSGAFST